MRFCTGSCGKYMEGWGGVNYYQNIREKIGEINPRVDEKRPQQ